MCEMLGSEPLDSEMPIEYEDLLVEVQEALTIYHALQDNWDSMNGVYIGKNFVGLLDILTLYEVEDKKSMFSLLRKLDEARHKAIRAKIPKPTKTPQ